MYTSAASAHKSPPPRLKDRYRLTQWLGEGGMATVYKALDERLDRDVAIKFLSPTRLSNPDASERFLREARAVARLSHGNIMALYDSDREGLWHYLVLEYVPGRDLHALMVERGGTLPPDEALHCIRQVLGALAYAHQQGLIHRDIKPENIMITPNGQVKVTDFGLALIPGDARLTQEDSLVGTALYLAPEAITGMVIDPRADLYSVGAVLYELLTGRPPFSGDHAMSIITQVLHGTPPPPRQLNPNIPAALEQVILKLLAKSPADRYESAEVTLAALPTSGEAPAEAVDGDEGAPRAASSLLERIVRSTTSHSRPAGGTAEAEDDDSPAVSQELLLYAAVEDITAAVETERRRLAGLLQADVIEGLNLLIAQASAYERSGGGGPAQMALSVITTLTRQLLQQVRDLEANLRPTVLDSLGLEPALESLAAQVIRAHGLDVDLHVARLSERLPPRLELALFRAAQDALDRAVREAGASRAVIRLEQRNDLLHFSVTDNGIAPDRDSQMQAACQRLEQLGAQVHCGISAEGVTELAAQFILAAPAQFTPREIEVLSLLAEGLSNKQIASALVISPSTVNFHLDNIYSKLGVNSRTEAAIYALRSGLVRRGNE